MIQKLLSHKVIVTPSGVAPTPLLTARTITKVKPHHNLARSVLSLIREERDSTLNKLQE